ncbi:ubiquitin-like FUBI-ribosomal protein eS30 fusion protein [Saccopteryx leptura]|uniref:ubiquitin-like FUBI-ribosomal protein eS30 fusion protein n=1 Tax=Saccopteryx leptura TaxID=249018 RepID=UPI00339D24BC
MVSGTFKGILVSPQPLAIGGLDLTQTVLLGAWPGPPKRDDALHGAHPSEDGTLNTEQGPHAFFLPVRWSRLRDMLPQVRPAAPGDRGAICRPGRIKEEVLVGIMPVAEARGRGRRSVAAPRSYTPRAQELHTLEVTGQETVAQITAHVASWEGIAPEDQVVLLAGTPLEDEPILGQCGVEALTSLEVAGRMLGGQVHGSLARAGKVRRQTPKVAEQEKKKKKTGQAKRRMQYNRRFVNVVPTFGKKKGPNANS